MKINIIAKYLLAATLFTGVVSCENPLKDFNLQISTEIIKHTATLKIVDLDGKVIPGATVTLNSGQTEDIYNLEGYKDFKVLEGLVVFGLDPNVALTGTEAVRFRVEVKAPGYTSQIVPVTITSASSGIDIVTLLKPTPPPATGGVEEKQTVVELAPNGATTTATVVQIPASAPGEVPLTVNIPAGVQFKNAAGQVITGSSVTINVTSFDPDNSDVEPLLPGGGFTTDRVILGDGTTASGTFSAANVARIVMLVNGVAVRQFSQPITVSMPIPSDYIDPTTGLALAAGQTLELYSNSATDNTWRFERTVTVAGNAASGFYVSFPTDHLTYFMTGRLGRSCANPIVINFDGPWMNNSLTAPITVEAIWRNDVIYTRQYSVSQSTKSISLANLPASGLKLRYKASTGRVLAETVVTPAICGTAVNVLLPDPTDPTSAISTLQLYVRCPDKTTPITLLPTFQMFYRESGTTEFKFLGTVNNGFLRTALLKTNGTKYDFQAFYKNYVKIVYQKTVTTDNTGTVGIQPGDIIGEKTGATNLAILKEECKSLNQ